MSVPSVGSSDVLDDDCSVALHGECEDGREILACCCRHVCLSVRASRCRLGNVEQPAVETEFAKVAEVLDCGQAGGEFAYVFEPEHLLARASLVVDIVDCHRLGDLKDIVRRSCRPRSQNRCV